MEYVICYDIADDRRRTRVSTMLLNFATRVQESVFVAHLDDDLFQRMHERLTHLIDVDWDRVHVFALCAACEGKAWAVGQAEIAADPPWYIV